MPAVAKTPCPVTREQFALHAQQSLVVDIDGATVVADKKEFSTGSLGWFTTGKITVTIDGVKVPVQAQVQLTLVNSKELPK